MVGTLFLCMFFFWMLDCEVYKPATNVGFMSPSYLSTISLEPWKKGRFAGWIDEGILISPLVRIDVWDLSACVCVCVARRIDILEQVLFITTTI